jgi:hypothetical protein
MAAVGYERPIWDGQSVAALPQCSDVDLFGDGERVVDLDAEVSDRALHLSVAEEQLYRAKVPGAPVDQSRLGSPQRVGAEQRRVQTDAGNPLRQQASILPGDEAPAFAAATMEQGIARMRSGCREVIVNSLASLLGELEPDRTTGLVLPNSRRSTA